MLGHKWKKTMTENSVDTYEKKFKKIQYLSNQISDCISLGDYEKVVMYDQKRKSLILKLIQIILMILKHCFIKKPKIIKK